MYHLKSADTMKPSLRMKAGCTAPSTLLRLPEASDVYKRQVLGAVFGLTSFAQCFGADAFGAALLSINPFLTFLVCVPTRTLMGFLAGVIFRGVHRIDKTKTVSYFVGGLSGAVLNTVFFMGLLMVCFWNTDYIQGLNQTMGGLGLWAFLIAFVGINGVVEAIVACAAGGIISKAVSKALRINE